MDSTQLARPKTPMRRILLPLTKILFDASAFLIVLAAWLILKFLVKPVRRAFLCSDLNLYHPKPPKNVFPTWLLAVCAVVIPFFLIFVSELVRWFYIRRQNQPKLVYSLRFGSRKFRVPEFLGNLYIVLGSYGFAHVINSFLTNIGKVTMGRLRPHFIPSCFNVFAYQGFCTNPNEWIWNYTCIGEDSSSIKVKDGAYDIRQSFPSGHASTAFCGLIFLALYIHKVWNYRNLGLFPYIFQAGCFALAAYIGITRITDNRHHPTDVLAGSILGTFIAIVAFHYVVKSFQRSINLADLDENEQAETEDF